MSTSRRLNLDQIAAAAHVSSLAVWQMLYGDKHKLRAGEIAQIEAALQELDIAALPPTRGEDASGTIMVVVPNGYHSAMDDFSGHVTQAFAAEAQQHGFALTLSHQWVDMVPDIRDLFTGFDCVVMIAAEKTKTLIEACEALGKPYVLVETEQREPGPGGVTINTDNPAATQAVMHHLFELGHRQIGFITGRRQNRSSQERLAAYLAALEEAGIAPDEDLIYPGTWLEPSGYDGARALLSRPEPPTAILAASDMMALGVMRAVRAAGLTIGADLSVAGFDDIALAARVAPALTTLRQRMAEMGHLAIDQVLSFVQGQRPEQAILLPADLIVRGSTGPAPGH